MAQSAVELHLLNAGKHEPEILKGSRVKRSSSLQPEEEQEKEDGRRTYKMQKKRNVGKWILLALLIAAVGAAGLLSGRYVAASGYQAEQELNYRLNRSDLDGLGKIEGPIYVTGHKSPDSDTVGSSIAYAALLQAMGYDARPVVLGKINNDTRYVLESGGLDTPMLLEDASGCNMVLVDHSEYMQSAEGLRDANVITIIDHHGDGSVTTGNQLIYDARPLGSTATIIWIRCRNYGIEPDQKTAYAMVGSILSDTKNLQSNATTFADREALKALSKIAGIDDTDVMYQHMYQASITYDGMTDEQIFYSDYKDYESAGRQFGIGCVNAYDEDGAQNMAERMKKVLSSVGASSGLDMLFAQISIVHDDISVAYLVPSSDAADDVLRIAFGDKAAYDGTSYRLEPNISRKQGLVPAVTAFFQSNPKG